MNVAYASRFSRRNETYHLRYILSRTPLPYTASGLTLLNFTSSVGS